MTKPKPTFTSVLQVEPIDCPKCGDRARIIRRSPDAFMHDGTEIWTFQCDNAHLTEVRGRN